MADETTTVTLTKSETKQEDLAWIPNISGFPIRVTATGTGLLEGGNVFVLQLSGTGLDPNQGDIFNRIASVPDITDLPTLDTIESMNSASIEGLISPFYRTNEIELFFETPELAEEAWKIIKSDVKLLVDNLNLKDKVYPTETVTIS